MFAVWMANKRSLLATEEHWAAMFVVFKQKL